MTISADLVGLADHPDETGPFLCEGCDATHPGPRDPALAEGWIFTWDGFFCPTCTSSVIDDESDGGKQMAIHPALVDLSPCICGAVVDQEECPYPTGAGGISDGRALFVVDCTNPDCGWQAIGWGADGARKAWNTRAELRALAGAEVGGWISVEDRLPIDGRVVLAGQQMIGMLSEPWLMQRNDGHWYWFPENTKASSYPSHWKPFGLIPPAPPEATATGQQTLPPGSGRGG